MRSKFYMLFIIPAMVISILAGTGVSNVINSPTDETAVETIPTTTVSESEFVTEPTLAPQTEPPTEPTVELTTPPETVPKVTEPVYTEPPVTEPAPTAATESEDDWKSLGTFKLTAYCSCAKCCGKYAANRPLDENGNAIVYTASGARAQAGVTIAVDPSVISYGTEVQINGHTYIAQDTGGAINGGRIDVYFDNHQDALNFGVQYAEVFVEN